ncbi:DUF4282 domain-containing protein [Haloechinothrix halophila]|uniref:DUF4282 domain-containing protein n=1 Tax=Haloechinothrix halophila TaxID=1069073 RepID=UPI00041ADD93|nr:DUF4282 domain-containing protein [Haloechinothrix halophila]
MGIFDVSFSKFITPTVVKVVYIILMVLLALGYVGAVIGGFANDAAAGFLVLILGPIFVFLYLLLIRVSLEALVAVVRTAENTTELVRIQGGGGSPAVQWQPQGGPPPGQPPYGGPPQQPGPHGGPQQSPYGQQPPPQTPPPGFYPNQ